MSRKTKEKPKERDFEDVYSLGQVIGRGAYSTVYKCEQKGTGIFWAVKVIDKKKHKHLISTEVGILLKLKHPNIVRFKEALQTPTRAYLVLEYVTGEELFERITKKGHYSEKDAAKAVKDICSAVDYLHRNGIVHRDLKPENMLYENPTEGAHLKITDFGLSKILGNDLTMSTVCGTPMYCAPEVLEGKIYTQSVDLWSIGVITYILLSGYEPFIAENDAEIYKKIIKCEYEFDSPYWDSISQNAKDLIRRLLSRDPKKRLSVTAALQHHWVRGTANKNVHMEACVEHIKDFNAKRKLKKATETVLAVAKATRHIPLDFMKMVNIGDAETSPEPKT
ncbi:hypothetical protein LOTGIDRAFT_215945 [Lottia gigantea]|uniref:Protein kinase domain-containing protein n=1 Tax=Lottia gigantea TaxID=225164 RepID=V4AJ37_LOTGI|nr:hypothetical protein LOTGIDRAFT_215945 [Lottia gigantea]ESO93541.1 hypothetical protein LOTGIDRAFT_215945 [Lottia gigantea]